MTRVAILGANGQVGAEVCLRLRQAPGIEVIAVARNVSGSAFLRCNDVECRHGRIGDPADAARLIDDCDVVVNFALSMTAIPRVDREVNRQIMKSVVTAARPGAAIVFASTIMVYAPAMKFWMPDAYGLEKWFAEKTFRRLARRMQHPCYVFRLGHVLGDLQNITRKICGEIAEGPVALPQQGSTASNTVFTSSIVEAIVRIARGQGVPGTYDLITEPQWTWLDVYRYYAGQRSLALQVVAAGDARVATPGASPGRFVRATLGYFANTNFLRERLTFALAFLPKSWNERTYTRYLQSRALREIQSLKDSKRMELCAPDWRELKVHGFPDLGDPEELMSKHPLRCKFGAAEFGS
jgi:nucleoside-diphosphate-sugar epimerase